MKIILKRFLVASLVLTLFLSLGPTAVQAAVQSITAGKGIDVEGTKDVTISVDKQFRLPQNCTSGQVAAWNGNRWSCVYNGLTLPFVTTGTWDTDVFSLTNLGTGAVGRFFLNNTSTSMPALWSQTQGTGNALSAHSEGSGNAIGAYMRGTGHAGQFRINNPANTNSALEVYTNGNGQAIDAYTTGDGYAISAGTSGNGFAALTASNEGTGMAGVFAIENPDNENSALQVKAGHKGTAFQSYMWGTGPAGQFAIDNPDNGSDAVNINTNGSGQALRAINQGTGSGATISVDNPDNSSTALLVSTKGSGRAASFLSDNPNRTEPTLVVESMSGFRPALASSHRGTGAAGYFSYQNPTANGVALYAENNGLDKTAYFVQSNPAAIDYAVGIGSDSVGGALAVNSNGMGPTVWFGSQNPENSSNVLAVGNAGTGWLGYFAGNGKGLYISVPEGNEGLNVASGTKNAVVATDDGARLLYTEESTQVWFTDYGFGKLKNGVARVAIDPLFAQTVNLNEPYHVFVQAYGDSNLYVTNRTRTGFEVRAREGNSDVEFSYRLVAKRLGYENKRLEHASWADTDVNLYPAK